MRGMHIGTLVVDRPFGGMLNGTAVVPAGADVEIGGMINGDVIVGAGASVRISGMVNGVVEDHGGTIDVTGMVRTIRRA